MALKETENQRVRCVVKFQCTENSQPFQTKVFIFKPNSKKIIGRTNKIKPIKDQDEKIHFENRVLSKFHAIMLYQQQKLYIKDLNSNHGTFLNGENIGTDTEVEAIAREVKTGDVLRFGNTLRIEANQEPFLPVEAKLLITSLKRKNAITKCVFPFEGQQDGGLPNVPKACMVIDHPTVQRGTVTERIEFCNSSTQTISRPKLPQSLGKKLQPVKEQSCYRQRTVQAVIIFFSSLVGLCFMITILALNIN